MVTLKLNKILACPEITKQPGELVTLDPKQDKALIDGLIESGAAEKVEQPKKSSGK